MAHDSFSSQSPAGATDPLERLRLAVHGDVETTDEPRHARLRSSLLALLADGSWAQGDKLPPEREIAESVGLSLGTVQKVLGRLAADGIVVRRHGHGTFVGAGSQSDQLIHFRFTGDDGVALLPVYAEAIDRTEVKSKGPWSSFLTDATAFIRVRRRINVANEFECLSEFYIDANRFREILSMPFHQLHRVVIRTILAERFNSPTLSVDQRIHAARIPDDVADLMQLSRKRRVGMILEVFSYTYNQSRVSFQRIHIPPDVRPLEIPSRKVHVK